MKHLFIGLLSIMVIATNSSYTQKKSNRYDQYRPDIFQGSFDVINQITLDKPTNVVFKLYPTKDVDNAYFRFNLPPGIELIEGQTQWHQNLKEGKEYILNFTLKVKKTGNYEIHLSIFHPTFENFNRNYILFINQPNENGSANTINIFRPSFEKMSPQQLKNYLKQDAILDTTSSNNAPQGRNPSNIQSSNITAHFEYTNDDGSRKPIRYSTVRVYEVGYIYDTEIGSSFTNASGDVTIAISCTGSKQVYAKVFNESSAAKGVPSCNILGCGPYESRVPNSGSVTFNCTSALNLGSYFFGNNYPNWQAVDNVIDEYMWISDHTAGWTRSQAVVLWPSNNCTVPNCSGWPCSDGDHIYLPDKSGCSYWDRLTIYHEYGHSVMYALYNNSFPGGCTGPSPHYIYSVSCHGFAITEGWAEFMEIAVPNSLNLNFGYNPSCSNPPNNIETNYWWKGGDCNNTNGAVVEGAVASILWDIYDAPNTDDDGLQFGFNNSAGSIWNIMKNYRPNGITAFWNTWRSLYGFGSEIWKIYYLSGINKDGTPPTNPTSVSSSSHSVSTWSNSRIISMTWSGASDDLSGVSGYSYLFDQNPSTITTATQNTSGTSLNSSSLSDGNNYYFHIRAKDNAGNWNSQAVHKGPYWIDGTSPINGTISINNGATSTTTLIVTLYNLGASDGGSGIAYIQFSNNNSTWSNWEAYATSKNNWDLSTYGGNTNTGQKWVYVKLTCPPKTDPIIILGS